MKSRQTMGLPINTSGGPSSAQVAKMGTGKSGAGIKGIPEGVFGVKTRPTSAQSGNVPKPTKSVN